jgi:uncharacterized protein (TIGR02145 family)
MLVTNLEIFLKLENTIMNRSFTILAAFLFWSILIISSCKDKPTIPVVLTDNVTNITQTTALTGGNVTNDGGAEIISKGVCWNTSPNPLVSNSKTSDGTGTGAFSSSITQLTPYTKYYLRSYSTNSEGTGYGNEVSFTTLYPETLTDIDGSVYNLVTIGTQTWMSENLKTTRYSNGDSIGTTTPYTLDIISESTPKYQWSFNGNDDNIAVYGRLYTWYAVTDNRNVCPTGWHVPAAAEWDILISFLGDWYEVAGGKLKEVGAIHWNSSEFVGTNESGFTGLPGGQRSYSNDFEDFGYYGYWWSTTVADPDIYAIGKRLEYASNSVITALTMKYSGYSVRCLKNH